MQKTRELNIPLYMAFVDFEKPFDPFRHTTLWETMKKMEVSGQEITPIQKLYQSQEVAVRIGSALSDCFNVNKGVRQGCPVSPISLNLYLEEAMRRTADELLWVGVCISWKHLSDLRFAHDKVLIATLPERLQAIVNEVDDVSKEFQLLISTGKTKIMPTTKEPQQLLIKSQGELLAQVDKFTYLESIVGQKAGCSYEIRTRLRTARSAFRPFAAVWNDRRPSS